MRDFLPGFILGGVLATAVLGSALRESENRAKRLKRIIKDLCAKLSDANGRATFGWNIDLKQKENAMTVVIQDMPVETKALMDEKTKWVNRAVAVGLTSAATQEQVTKAEEAKKKER